MPNVSLYFPIGGLIGIYLFSILFRGALLGNGGTKTQHIWVIMLTGIVAVGFSAFGTGTDGFVNRITHPADTMRATVYLLSAVVVALFTWRKLPKDQPINEQPKSGGMAYRMAALVFVIPMILIGVGNLAGSTYSVVVKRSNPDLLLGNTRTEIRQNMLNGEMAPFWRMMDDKAPEDLELIIDGLFSVKNRYRNADDATVQLNKELVQYRQSLAAYGPALTDDQRKIAVRNTTDFIREFENDPAACVTVVTKGGGGLSQTQLSAVATTFNRIATETFELLLAARASTTENATVLASATEDDYARLFDQIYQRGVSEAQLMVFLDQNTSHPDYCSMAIGYLDAATGLEGLAGERIRLEITQILFTSQ